jgi:hypothetical protein
MKSTLEEFVRTGHLGRLALGAAVEEVRRVLGPPEDTSVRKKNRPVIWKYGSLQLHFDHGFLSFIGLYFRDGEFRLPPEVSLGEWVPSKDTSLEEFREYLAQTGIAFHIDPAQTFEDQLAFQVGPGVSVIFDRDGERVRLDSIQYIRRTETTSPLHAKAAADSPQAGLK